MTGFAIRDFLSDKASRPVDFGKDSISHWTALARFMPDTEIAAVHLQSHHGKYTHSTNAYIVSSFFLYSKTLHDFYCSI